jgi:amidase
MHYLELHELTRLIRAGEISAVEATEAALARIALLDAKLRSFAWLTADLALEQARRADREIARGEIRSKLHGAPIGIKDLCWMKNVPTAAGMTLHRDFRPQADAEIVRRLSEAGAILLGKLQMTEGAYGDHHPDIPAPVTPGTPSCGPACPRAGPASRRPPGFAMAPSAPTRAARSGFRAPPTA